MNLFDTIEDEQPDWHEVPQAVFLSALVGLL